MVESDFCANTGRADRGARSVDLWGGRGFCILRRRSRANTRCRSLPGTIKPCSPAARTRGSRRDLPDPAPSAPDGQPSGFTGTPELGDSIRPGGFGGNGRSQSGLSGMLPHSREDGHWRGGPCPRARSRNTDCQQASNWAAKETAPYGRSSGGRSPRRKRRGGRLDSSSLSSLFDRGAQAKRVVLEIDGRGCRTPSPKRLQQPQSTYLPPQTEAKGWPLCVGLWKREIGAPFASHPPAVVFDGFLDGGVFFGKTHQLQPDRVD